MSRITKAQVNRAYQDGYTLGKEHGYAKGRQDERESFNMEKHRAMVQLISAVGQTLQTQSSVVQGLASVFDNTGGFRT